jgi:hypothetical protein
LFVRRYLGGASLTRYLDGFGGRGHTLRIGLETERITFHQVTGFPGGQSFVDASGVPRMVTLWAGDDVAAGGTRASMFVQDTWRAGRQVTVQPGLRVAVNRGSVADKGTVFRTNPVSPRLGVAWDVASDHRTLVRAVYDRLHEGLHPESFVFMNTARRTPRITARVNGPDDFEETSRVSPDNNVAVSDDLSHAHVDQFVAGIERQLSADFSLTFQYVRRTFEDIWAQVDTGSQYGLVKALDPGPDGELSTSDDRGLVDAYNLLNPGHTFLVLTNPNGAWRRYHGLQLVGQKRFSDNWQLLAAYSWSRTRGNVNTAPGDSRARGPDTGQNGIFVNPNGRLNSDGPISSDYTHQLTIQGVSIVPVWGDLTVSAGYSYLTGAAWGRTATLEGPQLLQEVTVRIEPRGTQRIEGTGFLDARVEKSFRLGRSSRTLSVFVDLLNLANEGVPLGLTVTEASGASLGEPTFWATPRTVRVAGRVRF